MDARDPLAAAAHDERERRHGGKRPGLLDAAWLSHRYRHEFATLEIPPPVRRFVFPVLAPIAGILGRRRRYADAPEPVRR